MNKLFVLAIIFCGIWLITIGFLKGNTDCVKERVVYKYLPRTFEDEQTSPVYVSDIFKTMFTQPSVWVATINNADTEKNKKINDFFVSQY